MKRLLIFLILCYFSFCIFADFRKEELFFYDGDKEINNLHELYDLRKVNFNYRFGFIKSSYRELESIIDREWIVVQHFYQYIHDLRLYIEAQENIQWAEEDSHLLINNILDNFTHEGLKPYMPPVIHFQNIQLGYSSHQYGFSVHKHIESGGIFSIKDPEVIYNDDSAHIVFTEFDGSLSIAHFYRLQRTIFKNLQNKFVYIGWEMVEPEFANEYDPQLYELSPNLALVYGEIDSYSRDEYLADKLK